MCICSGVSFIFVVNLSNWLVMVCWLIVLLIIEYVHSVLVVYVVIYHLLFLVWVLLCVV